MSEELRPCMKCGSSDIEVIYLNRAFCRCRKCGTKGKEYPTGNEQFAEYIDREAAIKDWNTRPVEDALQEKLNKKNEELDRAHLDCAKYLARIAVLEAELEEK